MLFLSERLALVCLFENGEGGLGKGETESRNTLTGFLMACLAGNKVAALKKLSFYPIQTGLFGAPQTGDN